jgi:Transcriptional Coactivator p15 (PC4)
MTTLTLSEHSKIDFSSFKTKDGAKFLNVRKFYKTKNSEDWLPTKQGITIPEDAVPKFLKRIKAEFEAIDENAVELEDRNKGKGKSKDKDKDEPKKTGKKKSRDSDSDED